MSVKVFKRTHDPIWHLQAGVLVVIGLQMATDPALLPYNKYVLLGLEGLLMIALAIVTPDAYHRVSPFRRTLAMTLIAVVAIANAVSLLLLLTALTTSTQVVNGHSLLLNAATIYVTNIFMFALWYWEMDGGGPDGRVAEVRRRDFMFSQMAHPDFGGPKWRPGFADYLYLSATNVTNFASADTVPLTHRAKMIMMGQSLASVVLVVLVIARAVSIIG